MKTSTQTQPRATGQDAHDYLLNPRRPRLTISPACNDVGVILFDAERGRPIARILELGPVNGDGEAEIEMADALARAFNSYAADQEKIKALVEALENAIKWAAYAAPYAYREFPFIIQARSALSLAQEGQP